MKPGSSGVERLARHAPLAVLVLACLSLLIPIAGYGVWDPYELRSMDLARRIASGLYHGSHLELEGLQNALPTRGELDRGELPFTSMALGLRLFGLSAWAGRLPLCVWAMLGLVATYICVARLADRVAAALSVIVLATMPLYFVHARTMLGDAVTMASLSIAMSGLALSLFDRSSLRVRASFFAVGLLGLVFGALSRGVLLGVAVPALGVGLGWLVPRLAGALEDEPGSLPLAISLLVIGTGAALVGLAVLGKATDTPERYFALLGFGYSPPASPPTFDAILQQIGHGLFPWSALVPPVLARLAMSPRREVSPGSIGLRATVVLFVAVGITAWGGLAPFASVLPFGAVAPLAVAIALVLRDLDLGAPASRTFGLFAAALAVLLLADFRNFPEELLGVFALGPLKYPDSLRESGAKFLSLSTIGAAGVLFFATEEKAATPAQKVDAAPYLTWFRTLRDAWNGNLLFALLVFEAAAIGFFAFDLLGRVVPALDRFVTRSELGRLGATFGWLVVPFLLVAPVATMGVRDLFRLLDGVRSSPASRGLVPGRGTLGALAILALGSALSLFFYPMLANQLSPQESFEAFRRFAKPGEPLGVVASGALAPLSAGPGAESFRGPEEAYRWLLEPGGRRFLVVRADALASLNARYRSRVSNRSNVPILDAHSSEILLASNLLRPGEKNENPLDAYLLGSPPHPSHPLDANLGDQLDVLGWDITDTDDRPQASVVPGRRYRFVIYYRVVARISGTWETFVHIDGFQRRFNGDHKTLDGRYPFALWQVGDFISDRHEIELEPNFTAGTYQVYFGLFSGSRRLPVKRGAHHEDRVQGGPLEVR